MCRCGADSSGLVTAASVARCVLLREPRAGRSSARRDEASVTGIGNVQQRACWRAALHRSRVPALSPTEVVDRHRRHDECVRAVELRVARQGALGTVANLPHEAHPAVRVDRAQQRRPTGANRGLVVRARQHTGRNARGRAEDEEAGATGFRRRRRRLEQRWRPEAVQRCSDRKRTAIPSSCRSSRTGSPRARASERDRCARSRGAEAQACSQAGLGASDDLHSGDRPAASSRFQRFARDQRRALPSATKRFGGMRSVGVPPVAAFREGEAAPVARPALGVVAADARPVASRGEREAERDATEHVRVE